MVKLSIIIPYYKTKEYTIELLDQLKEQITNEVEVLVIDDGTDDMLPYIKNTTIYRLEKNSGNASRPRNVGLDNAKGEYITFIDSDDYVSNNYISEILKAIEKRPDIIFLSWKSKVQEIIMQTRPPRWNCAVWCRVYKRDIIGNIRFDETLRIAEDWKFNQEVKYKTSKCIRNIIYFYNNGREGSLTNNERKN